MMAQLEGNPLGQALALTTGGLAAVLLLLGILWVLPPSGSEAPESEGSGVAGSDVMQLKPAEPIETYAVISDRPVFNQSRQPVIGPAEGEGDEEELQGEEVVGAPEVELAGVVITPELRVATLKLKDSPDSLMAFEGQPLEGDFGSWHLSSIEPRQAILESAQGEQVKLELQIHDAMMEEPPEVKAARQAAAESAGSEEQQAESGDQPMTRAEEIRQRIAERREELRRAAEEGQAPDGLEESGESRPPQANYRDAIEQMMQGRRKQDQDESEQ